MNGSTPCRSNTSRWEENYGYDIDELDPTEFGNSVMLALRPERWIGWSDAD
jgi:hypothetical protein